MASASFLLLSLLILTPTTDRLVSDLGSTDWRTRQQASCILACRMDHNQAQQLEKELARTTDLEVAHRLRVILEDYRDRLEPPPPDYIDNGPFGLMFRLFFPGKK